MISPEASAVRDQYCVKSRGVMDVNSQTETTALGGIFETNERTRAEFLI
ncbi:hypothetical protein [Amphritea sp.]